MKYKSLIPLLPASLLLCTMVFSHSCANTTQAPTGGPKDTIPPQLIRVSPSPSQLNVQTAKTEMVFTFNEYVVVKDQKNLYLSPPPSKPLKSKLKGKSVVVYLDKEDQLLPNTTYTLDVTGAIGDNNEGNMFPGYALTFSTGERIDSMYITGIVQDCSTLMPVKGATVMLYKDQADSAVFKQRPCAAAKTDDWGFFCIRNIQDTVFRLYAIMDENSNNMFDPETEKVAFLDTLIRPSHKIADKVYELYKFDMKDTAACLRRHNDVELYMFKGENSKQAVMNKERTGERSAYVTFMAPFVQLKGLWFTGIPKKNVLRQFNETQDSLLVWIKDPKKQKDTLFMNVHYMRTDSTGVLRDTIEKFKLPRNQKSVAKKSSTRDLKHEDTIAVYKVEQTPETFEQYGIKLCFESPLLANGMDEIKYEITNPRQQVSTGKYIWYKDTTDIRSFVIMPQDKIQKGFEYKFTVPYRKFKDINGHYNDSTVVSIKLPDDDKLSSLTLNLTGVESNYIVDLMNEKRDKVLRSYTVKKNSELYFPYLKDGKYCIRITEDLNGNNRVDTGDLLGHRQPEKVRFYKMNEDSFLLPVPPSADMIQDIDIKKIFE